ncbi:metallophosphoesterase family protein [Ovoidimarina sediminis]|uniref:metallophosphoesterase family protein n=1 Tax=Ovoidimarina sediminis TaxID=3079856 RepID=UPI002911D12D|nr:metallophosphoesterase family protein [Rhodophyticola sp. MJ-SS7]MDU8942632.1 metallophosphoesterase family protein [Rhodophyticola sp. MJ-SS7]
MRVYAIGDIHGHLDKLEEAHARIAADRRGTGDAAAPVIHLGDYCDRGPDSRGVLQFLIDGQARGAPWITLRGNHDRVFLDQLDDAPGAPFRFWTSPGMGGLATAESYGVSLPGWTFAGLAARKFRSAVPEAHHAFLKSLPLFHETETHIFVHAGIRPGLPLTEQIEEDLIWIRHEFLGDPRDHGKVIVHGHTPCETPEHWGNRINLDTGAGYGRALTAAVFEGTEVFVLGEAGRVPLRPRQG